MREPHGGEVEWDISRKYNIPIDKITSFATTVSYIKPKIPVNKYSKYIHRYPPMSFKPLNDSVAKLYGAKEENIILGSGTEELIYLFFSALGKGEAIIPVPTYNSYTDAAARYSISRLVSHGSDFELDIGKISEAVSRRTKAIVICNPNNPTGRLYRKSDLIELAKISKDNGATLLVDENYMWFVEKKLRYTMADFIGKYPVFVLNGISKSFSAPGLRVGWGVGQKLFIDTLNGFKTPTTIGTMNLFLANALLENMGYAEKSAKRVISSKKRFYSRLRGIKSLRVFPSDANFFLIKILDRKINSTGLFRDLAKRGIAIRDCANLKGLNDRFIRVTVRSDSDNSMLINAIKRLL